MSLHHFARDGVYHFFVSIERGSGIIRPNSWEGAFMSRRSITSLVCCALLVSIAFAASAVAPALAAAPPEKLAWEDLVDHPERWPEKVKLTKMIRFSVTDSIDAGTECRVIGV